MISLPKVVKSLPVFSTDKPVTQTALVEVNKASKNEIPCVVALGSVSRKAPISIITIKLLMNNWAGLSIVLLKLIFKSENSLIKVNTTAIITQYLLSKNGLGYRTMGLKMKVENNHRKYYRS